MSRPPRRCRLKSTRGARQTRRGVAVGAHIVGRLEALCLSTEEGEGELVLEAGPALGAPVGNHFIPGAVEALEAEGVRRIGV